MTTNEDRCTESISQQIADFKEAVDNISFASPLTEGGRLRLTNLKVGTSTIPEICKKNRTLTVEQFCEDWFVDAEFESYGVDSNGNDIGCYMTPSEITHNQTIKYGFEKTIRKLNDSFFTIMGSARSGKTTYMHYLRHKLLGTHVFHISDFETVARCRTIYESQERRVRVDIEQSKYEDNVWKFYCVLLDILVKLVFEHHKGMGKTHHEYINDIKSAYDELFGTLSTELTECAEFYGIFSQPSAVNCYDFADAIKMALPHNNLKKDASRASIDLLNLLERFLFCLAKMSGKKHLIVIDNIEQFISCDKKHPVQYYQLTKIFQIVSDSLEENRKLTGKIIQEILNHRRSYGMLLVTRTATNEYNDVLRPLQNNGNDETNCIDISSWFSPVSIFRKKMKKFEEIGVALPQGVLSTAFNNIMSDSYDSEWSLKPLLQRYFDGNIELVYDKLADALIRAVVRNVSFSELEFFNQRWIVTHKDDNIAEYRSHDTLEQQKLNPICFMQKRIPVRD